MTRSRTGSEQGDVVLVRFVFTDETGAKHRPAVILSTSDYHQGRQEAIIAAITSNVQRQLVGDHLIEGWQEAGLLFPSTATGIIRREHSHLTTTCRVDTPVEVDYYRNGGILQTVLRGFLKE